MTRPTFDDLTLPDELVQELRERGSFWLEDIGAAYRAGAQQAAEQLAGQWPEPITDRPPTEADGDDKERIQFLFMGGWSQCLVKNWEGEPWLHTPRWQPPAPPTLKEQALVSLRMLEGSNVYGADPGHFDAIRRALEAQS